MSPRAVILLVVCFALCVQCLPTEPQFRQMSLEAHEASTNAEIQTISSRITFLQKLNKLTYDTTLFTRRLRWLLRRSLSEKPTVLEIANLMASELDISKSQIDVTVEGVADELKLEVKQGIIALKAGLAFIEDNYVAGSNPQADAIIAKIKANLAALEGHFGNQFGGSAGAPPAAGLSGRSVSEISSTGAIVAPSASSTGIVEPVPSASSTGIVEPVPSASSSGIVEPVPSASSTGVIAPTHETSSTAPTEVSSTGFLGQVSSTVAAPTHETSSAIANTEVSTASSPTPTPTLESSTGHHNETSSSTGSFALVDISF